MSHLSTHKIDSIRKASRAIVRELGFMQEDLADSKLPASAVHTLIEIAAGSVSNATELKLLLDLEKSSISRLLKSLVQKGFLKTAADPSDARLQVLELTTTGQKKVAEIERYARRRLQGALQFEPLGNIELITRGLQTFASALKTAETPEEQLTVVYHTGYKSTLLGFVVTQHAQFYSKNYNFGATFETKVAAEMAEFLGRIDNARNIVFSATMGDQLVGAVSIDGEDLGHDIAHLRWFIVSDDTKGMGVGKQLISRAMEFIDQQNFKETQLWTFKGLDAARNLYERVGFQLIEEKKGAQWGTEVFEQRFVR